MEIENAACAHLTVLWTTKQLEGNVTRGWWACKDCGKTFSPVEDVRLAEQFAAHTALQRRCEVLEQAHTNLQRTNEVLVQQVREGSHDLMHRFEQAKTERDTLQRRCEEAERLLPQCMGEWIDGSGGHRVYDGKCPNRGVWDVGLGFVCDEHKNKNGGDDDAWRWWEERAKLERERD